MGDAVCATAALDGIVPQAAVEIVRPLVAPQVVGPVGAPQHIVAVAAVQVVGRIAAGHGVDQRPAPEVDDLEAVVGLAGRDGPAHRRPDEGIGQRHARAVDDQSVVVAGVATDQVAVRLEAGRRQLHRHRVVALITGQLVITIAADQLVIALFAPQAVGRPAAGLDDVVAEAAGHVVGAIAAKDVVIALAAVDAVRAGVAIKDVVRPLAMEGVVVVTAVDGVGQGIAGHGVRATQTVIGFLVRGQRRDVVAGRADIELLPLHGVGAHEGGEQAADVERLAEHLDRRQIKPLGRRQSTIDQRPDRVVELGHPDVEIEPRLQRLVVQADVEDQAQRVGQRAVDPIGLGHVEAAEAGLGQFELEIVPHLAVVIGIAIQSGGDVDVDVGRGEGQGLLDGRGHREVQLQHRVLDTGRSHAEVAVEGDLEDILEQLGDVQPGDGERRRRLRAGGRSQAVGLHRAWAGDDVRQVREGQAAMEGAALPI